MRKKTKFCVTIVQTFEDEYVEEGTKQFCQQLLELGATDEVINKLVLNNSVFWYDVDNTQSSIIAAELIREKTST
jgi:hypothetical protein